MIEQHALVTGAGGFIGRHLVDRLLDNGRHVSALTRAAARWPHSWADRVERIECNDWSEAGIRRALAPHRFEIVFHLAAYGINPVERDIDQMLAINVAMPAALVRVCSERGARLLMAGSFSEYKGPTDRTPVVEDSPLETVKLYGASKAAGGLLASAVASRLGVDLRLLRLFHVYGPGEAGRRLLPTLIAGLSKGERVALSPGSQVLDFVHVSDVVESFMRAEGAVLWGTQEAVPIWNVCTGVGHSVRTFATLVAHIIGAPTELLGFGDRPMRPDDAAWLVGNGGRMKQDLGWQPACDLETGLRVSIASLKAGPPRDP